MICNNINSNADNIWNDMTSLGKKKRQEKGRRYEHFIPAGTIIVQKNLVSSPIKYRYFA